MAKVSWASYLLERLLAEPGAHNIGDIVELMFFGGFQSLMQTEID